MQSLENKQHISCHMLAVNQVVCFSTIILLFIGNLKDCVCVWHVRATEKEGARKRKRGTTITKCVTV